MATGRTSVLMGGSAFILAVAAFGLSHWLPANSDGSKRARSERTASAAPSVDGEVAVDNDVQVPFLKRMAVGNEHHYRLDYSAKAQTPDGQEVVDFRVAAELSLTRIREGNDDLLELRLSNISARRQQQNTELSALTQQLAVPVYGRYRADGELTSVHAPSGIDPGVLMVLTYLLADLQLQAPSEPARSWEAEETDPIGVYAAVYRRKAERQISRAHRRYQSLHQSSATHVNELSHVSTFGFSAEGRLDNFDSRARIVQSSQQLVVQALTEVHAQYAGQRASGLARLPAGLATFPIKGAGAAAARAVPARPAADLAASLRTTVGDKDGHFFEKQALADRLREHPNEIGDVVAALRSALDGYESARLISALTMTGTPEATKAVADLVRDKNVAPTVRDQAVTELAVNDRPTADSVKELSQLADDTTIDAPTRRAALLGVGANLRNAPADVVTADQRTPLTSKLEDQALRSPSPTERQTAFGALGNVGSAAHFDTIAAGLTSPNPMDRAAAVFALRHIQTPAAERAILKALVQDPSPAVRSDAADALANRQPQTELVASTLLGALEREPEPAVQRVLVSVLGLYLNGFPELRQGLAALEATTTNQELKQQLASLLKHPQQGAPPSL